MRIITGRARGMNLFSPKNYAVRPTADRVKESVFNILGSRVQGVRVIDVFAGSGNLGLEAWSRGAQAVIFMDKSRESLKLVRRNVEKCRAGEDCKLMLGDGIALLGKFALNGEQAGLIFLDPPYHYGLVDRALQAIEAAGILAPGGLIVAERAADEGEISLPQGLESKRTEKYGSTVIDFIGTV